jgi:hypothetical protein
MKKIFTRLILPFIVASIAVFTAAWSRTLEPLAVRMECSIHSCGEAWSVKRYLDGKGSPDVWQATWDVPMRNMQFLATETKMVGAPDFNFSRVIVLPERADEEYDVAVEKHNIPADPNKGKQIEYQCVYRGRIKHGHLGRKLANGTLSCVPDAGKWRWEATIRTVTSEREPSKPE